ncbi:hypothetical protein D3C73_683570 [compost metagenome]
MPLRKLGERPGLNGVGVDQLSPAVFFHFLCLIAHGKNHILSGNPAMIGIAGDAVRTIFIVHGSGMRIDGNAAGVRFVYQGVYSAERIGLCIASRIQCRRLAKGVVCTHLIRFPEFGAEAVGRQCFVFLPQSRNILRCAGIEQAAAGNNLRINV